jgi:hypothetical protein
MHTGHRVPPPPALVDVAIEQRLLADVQQRLPRMRRMHELRPRALRLDTRVDQLRVARVHALGGRGERVSLLLACMHAPRA